MMLMMRSDAMLKERTNYITLEEYIDGISKWMDFSM